MSLTGMVIIAGAALFGLYLLGRLTPESRMRQPLIETSTVLEWVMAEAFAVKFKRELVDFHFDEIDKAVADRYQAAIATTQNIENVKKEVEARRRM